MNSRSGLLMPTKNILFLVWGTPKENASDRAKHGRDTAGERNGSSVLTARQVRKIRWLFAKGNITKKDLGAMFEVSDAMVGLIVRRENWKHV